MLSRLHAQETQRKKVISLAQLRKVRADVFANVEDAMKDPHPRSYYAQKEISNSKANVTKTKNNNEKNKADARRLSSCVDYSGWKDADDWVVRSTLNFLYAAELKHGRMPLTPTAADTRRRMRAARAGGNRRNRRNASRKALCSHRGGY